VWNGKWELENAIKHAAVFCEESVILPKHLPVHILPKSWLREGHELAERPYRSLAEIEREHIQRVLSATQGNRKQTAKTLGIGEATLYWRLGESPSDRQFPCRSRSMSTSGRHEYK